MLEHEGLRYSPDVVLWVVFLGNDLYDLRFARRFYWPRPYFTLDAGELTLHTVDPSWDVRMRMSSYLGEIAFRGLRPLIPSEVQAAELVGRDSVELFTAIARRFAADCTAHGARLLTVIIWPTKAGDFDSTGDGPRVIDALSAIPIEVLDTHELMSEDQPNGHALWQPRGHWTPLGHERVATAVSEKLSALGWLQAH
jgi:hypothetical protein